MQNNWTGKELCRAPYGGEKLGTIGAHCRAEFHLACEIAEALQHPLLFQNRPIETGSRIRVLYLVHSIHMLREILFLPLAAVVAHLVVGKISRQPYEQHHHRMMRHVTDVVCRPNEG